MASETKMAVPFPKVDIVIRAKDGHDLTAKAIKSIRDNTAEGTYRIILVDDGSSPPLFETLEDPGDLYIARPQSGGAVSASNLGMSASLAMEDSKYIMIMDNDASVPDGDDGWLLRFMAELVEFDDTAVVGATTNFANPPQHILFSPMTYTADWQDEETRRAGEADNPEVVSLVSFTCLIRKEVIRSLGLWDTRYDPGNYEDTDFAATVRAAGMKVRVARSVYIHHEGHKTFSNDLKKLLKVNQLKFMKKWGVGRLEDMGFLKRGEGHAS